jgi:RNA polymerase sigma-70 factor (ECF subfamily)
MAMSLATAVEPASAVFRRPTLIPLAKASDAELARALIDGQPEAYEVAWQRFMPLVSGMTRRVFGRGPDRDDVVQEICFCLFRRVQTLRDPVALRAFVIAVAARTLSHERRRRKVRFLAASEGEERAAEAMRITSDPAAKHAFLSLQQLVARLRRRERMAFVLRYVEGMDAAEVAAILGVSAPTARRSFSRAWKLINLWAGRDPFLADYLRQDAVAQALLQGAEPSLES